MLGRRRRGQDRLVIALVVLGLAVGAQAGGAPTPRAVAGRRRPRMGRARCRTTTWLARTAWARPGTRTSKVWFTVADGVLSDVYYPTIDNTNVETLQFVVTDGSDVHRPADPGHHVHRRRARHHRDVLPRDQHRQERPLHVGHRLPDRPGPQRVVIRTSLKPRTRGTHSISTSASTRRSTATAVVGAPTGVRTTRSRDMSTGRPCPGRHRHQHLDHRREPGLRPARVRSTATPPSVQHCEQRVCGHRERRTNLSSTPTTGWRPPMDGDAAQATWSRSPRGGRADGRDHTWPSGSATRKRPQSQPPGDECAGPFVAP